MSQINVWSPQEDFFKNPLQVSLRWQKKPVLKQGFILQKLHLWCHLFQHQSLHHKHNHIHLSCSPCRWYQRSTACLHWGTNTQMLSGPARCGKQRSYGFSDKGHFSSTSPSHCKKNAAIKWYKSGQLSVNRHQSRIINNDLTRFPFLLSPSAIDAINVWWFSKLGELQWTDMFSYLHQTSVKPCSLAVGVSSCFLRAPCSLLLRDPHYCIYMHARKPKFCISSIT